MDGRREAWSNGRQVPRERGVVEDNKRLEGRCGDGEGSKGWSTLEVGQVLRDSEVLNAGMAVTVLVRWCWGLARRN